mmetsp:Transcript_39227/g.95297  ORF Transcript_39227/g.95297 Transcript_39227/m.95297 type:complete len:477 (-) Transcript_39227:173-1603(-)
MTFHSHFSDGSRQDAATTHEHMKVLLDFLKSQGQLFQDCIYWEDTDGCSKQYRCGNALYLLSLLACTYSITIDRAIGAPGHGKEVVDGLNAVDKRYLTVNMRFIHHPEVDDDNQGKMIANTMKGDEKVSLAEECARLCSCESRVDGVKSEGGKRAKREKAAKVKSRHYHVHREQDEEYNNMSMVVKGFQQGEHQGIIAHYSIRVCKELGLGRAALRRIPCACPSCKRQMHLPWCPNVEAKQQPRYAIPRDCEMWPIFKSEDGTWGWNDWKIVDIVTGSNKNRRENTEAAQGRAKRAVLVTIADRMVNAIKVGDSGAINVDDTEYEGFYLCTWTSLPYTLQEDKLLQEYDPPMQIKAGEHVCDASYWNLVPRARFWYTPDMSEQGKTVVRLQQILHPAVLLEAEGPGIALPNTCRKADARAKGARKLNASSHDQVLDEKRRRDMLCYEESASEDSEDELSESEHEQEEDSMEEEENE